MLKMGSLISDNTGSSHAKRPPVILIENNKQSEQDQIFKLDQRKHNQPAFSVSGSQSPMWLFAAQCYEVPGSCPTPLQYQEMNSQNTMLIVTENVKLLCNLFKQTSQCPLICQYHKVTDTYRIQ